MTLKKVTVESEREEQQKALCDQIIYRAAVMMTEEVGASIPMMIDRMLTYALAQACKADSSPRTAAALRLFADKVENGLFHSVTGEGSKGH